MGLLRRVTLLATALVGVVRAGELSALDLISPEPPTLPNLTSVSFSGNGCPQGTAEYVNLNSRWSEAIFAFDRFRAEDPGTSPTERTQNCQVHANLEGGATGWQVAVQSMTVRGFASLSAGSALTAYGTVYWSQNAANVSGGAPGHCWRLFTSLLNDSSPAPG